MNKNEVLAKLEAVAGNSEYGRKVIDEFTANFDDDDKKYGQTIKDRLDDRLGDLKGWLNRDEEKGTGNPNEVKHNIEIIEKMIDALK